MRLSPHRIFYNKRDVVNRSPHTRDSLYNATDPPRGALAIPGKGVGSASSESECGVMQRIDGVARSSVVRLIDRSQFANCRCSFHVRLRDAGDFLGMDVCEECEAGPGESHDRTCFSASCMVCGRTFGWDNLGGVECSKTHAPELGCHTGTRYTFADLVVAHERNWFVSRRPGTVGWTKVDGCFAGGCEPDLVRVRDLLLLTRARIRRVAAAVLFAGRVHRLFFRRSVARLLGQKLPTDLAERVAHFYRAPTLFATGSN